MKTTKFLTVALGLFLVGNVNVNVVLAQEENMEKNDSIYGLEVSRENGAISFYSTYDMNNAKTIHISSYDENKQLSEYTFYQDKSDLNFIEPLTADYLICEKITEGIYKVNRSNSRLIRHLILENTPTKIEIYIEGEGFTPPSNLGSGDIGRSNILTFFFNSMTTFLMESKANKNYIYKYFLLSGKESLEIPVGIPFIQMTYKDDVFLYSEKCLIQK